MKIRNKNLKIIAGPCSVSKNNIKDIYEIADLKINNQRVIWGLRVVGLKSRTNFVKDGKGMGMDFKDYVNSLRKIIRNKNFKYLKIFNSVKLAQKIYQDTKLLLATEIIDPLIQPALYEKIIPADKLLLWNPAVSQLGWPIWVMSQYIKRNRWYLGLKNPKWVGDYLKNVNNLHYQERTTMEKTWEGLVSYADLPRERIILIHRGVDVAEKKNYRNAPVHYLAWKVKKHSGCLLFFDPSHSHGPQMREKILPATIKAMKMMIDNEYLYDGILIEVGNSETDTEQHITLKELRILCYELSKFRKLEMS
ncbi:MAG: hypothetical protein KatS3mg095_1002 [Candidatus Parcubacteria bacterium]|nr:MAG: hypothetical protein KatS3mg095_1002 [Candidatus Parcubacteria bacterium]